MYQKLINDLVAKAASVHASSTRGYEFMHELVRLLHEERYPAQITEAAKEAMFGRLVVSGVTRAALFRAACEIVEWAGPAGWRDDEYGRYSGRRHSSPEDVWQDDLFCLAVLRALPLVNAEERYQYKWQDTDQPCRGTRASQRLRIQTWKRADNWVDGLTAEGSVVEAV